VRFVPPTPTPSLAALPIVLDVENGDEEVTNGVMENGVDVKSDTAVGDVNGHGDVACTRTWAWARHEAETGIRRRRQRLLLGRAPIFISAPAFVCNYIHAHPAVPGPPAPDTTTLNAVGAFTSVCVFTVAPNFDMEILPFRFTGLPGIWYTQASSLAGSSLI
jgi:hypothetical protein